ncbi:microtubule-associated serine/threonine-protein kinase 2-like isoform X5 [Dermacentor albipictus]|uniref:microtubule-associated serine/threonine-protein kinase 2-like isoform X5 n=1 Tax=Dermacentor albipictus TaxID=60249 RepID=UPI0031FD4FA8
MHATAERSLVEKGKQAAKTITTLFPRIPKTCTTLLEVFIKRESKVSLLRDPLTHFCEEELVLHAQECLLKINKQVVTFQDIRSMAENLIGLHTLCIKRDPDVARTQGENMRKLIIIVGELAGSLERMCDVPVTDWVAIADSLMGRMEKLNLPKTLPFATYIPKIRDFENVRMLGAGGFGAVYLARYKPVGFEASLKLVNMDRFSRHKQAAMDKVVASVIRNPFLVKYYSCYCVKEAYVTIMEFIPGLDLQRVVTKAEYLKVDAVQIIMAQLILAIEHMHLHGFLHRDIKVSNMLIMPGGRVKVIDFDTTKVCHGHFSKRVLRHYFKRTAFEFNDSESAGTIPYMAPEILKRRPYGRSVDWWSSGIVMYKLMTGKVPFRGKTKQMLRERIITAPLKWPRATDAHGHSATTPAKDMTYRLLRKNPAERLGSRIYSDLKTHSFFDGFNWKQLYTKKDLIDIPAIKQVQEEDKKKASDSADEDDERRHQQIDDMTDILPEMQKPLLCYASKSFRKLMLALKEKHGKVNADMMDTSGNESSELRYDRPKRKQSIPEPRRRERVGQGLRVPRRRGHRGGQHGARDADDRAGHAVAGHGQGRGQPVRGAPVAHALRPLRDQQAAGADPHRRQRAHPLDARVRDQPLTARRSSRSRSSACSRRVPMRMRDASCMRCACAMRRDRRYSSLARQRDARSTNAFLSTYCEQAGRLQLPSDNLDRRIVYM